MSGLFQPGRAQQMFQGGEYRNDATGLKSDRADIGSFSTVAEQARKILLATVGWFWSPIESRRLALLSIPRRALVVVSFLLPCGLSAEGTEISFVVNRAFPGTSVPEAVKLSAPARNFPQTAT